MNWTDDEFAALKSLNEEGYSASGIAERMNARFPHRADGTRFTKNSVISKLSRKGVSMMAARTGVYVVDRRPRLHPRIAVVKAQPPIPIKEPDYLGPLNDFPASNTCRFIKGEPGYGDWQCCGQPVQEPSPYCPFHHARCFSKIATAHSRDKFRSPNSAEAKAA